jgi:hypothetical protein
MAGLSGGDHRGADDLRAGLTAATEKVQQRQLISRESNRDRMKAFCDG